MGCTCIRSPNLHTCFFDKKKHLYLFDYGRELKTVKVFYAKWLYIVRFFSCLETFFHGLL
jgi:hypothetical protein